MNVIPTGTAGHHARLPDHLLFRPAGSGGTRLLAAAWLLLLALAPVQAQAAPAGAAPVTLRVMTYNIHHGEGLDGKLDLERIAALIRRERADLVALQEVDKGVRRTAGRDLPAELAALTGMSCVFSNNLSYQGGQYGNAILTRFPVVRGTNSALPMVKPGGEPRGVLQLVLTVHNRELVFMDTHLDFRGDDADRLQSADQLLELAAQYGSRPVILCGDFNDSPNSRTCQKLSRRFLDSWSLVGQGDGFTIPAQKPRKRIDYLWLLKDRGMVPLKLQVLESEASDHRPVVGEFRWDQP